MCDHQGWTELPTGQGEKPENVFTANQTVVTLWPITVFCLFCPNTLWRGIIKVLAVAQQIKLKTLAVVVTIRTGTECHCHCRLQCSLDSQASKQANRSESVVFAIGTEWL